MATINKIYPHVNVTTKALLRKVSEGGENGATSLFVPFYSKKGPTNKVQKIFNLSQFISEYGEPDYTYQGRTILNIYNWLSSGGAIYALRLISPDAIKASAEIDDVISVQAKYEGEYYNDISLYIKNSRYSTANEKFLDVQILLNNQRVQSLYKLNAERFAETLSSTEYISVSLLDDFDALVTEVDDAVSGLTIALDNGDDGSFIFEDTLARFYGISKLTLTSDTFNLLETDNTNDEVVIDLDEVISNNTTTYVKWAVGDYVTAINQTTNFINGKITGLDSSSITLKILTRSNNNEDIEGVWSLKLTDGYVYPVATTLIVNKLETPIDVILDSGYALVVKSLLKEFSKIRDDIFFFLTDVDFSSNNNGIVVPIISERLNQAVYTQKVSIEDIISGKNIWVAPTYFLASLIPFNDRVYGLQWTTAGLTRGVLTGVKNIDMNPTSEDKEFFYSSRINYIEKDSRGYKFMSQLTGDGYITGNINDEYQETALKFINNARVTNRIVRDLEALGRDYLFEFNDATTLLNMRNALNRYITEWIQNRTLNIGTVEVAKDSFSDERVNVTLNIKFTGTIEIISIDITIE